jgi:hypothetical protein
MSIMGQPKGYLAILRLKNTILVVVIRGSHQRSGETINFLNRVASRVGRKHSDGRSRNLFFRNILHGFSSGFSICVPPTTREKILIFDEKVNIKKNQFYFYENISNKKIFQRKPRKTTPYGGLGSD